MTNGIIKLVLASFTLCIAASCNETNEEKIENTADRIGSKVESGFSNIKDEIGDYRDEAFVDNVLEENGELLYLLQLAGTKGTAGYVKDASVGMKKHHRDIQDKFLAYARQNNIEVKQHDYKDNLETKDRGQDWDNAWNRQLTNKHEKLINKFERKADNANDPELQRLASSHLPDLRQHLNTLQQNKQ